MPANRLRRQRGELLLLGITLIWSTTFLVIQSGLEGVSPLQLMVARFACASLCFVPWLPHLRQELSWPAFADGLLLGLCTCASFSLQTYSLRYTTIAHAAFATSLSTVFVPLICIIWRRHRAAGTYLALLLAAIGLGLLMVTELEPGVRLGDGLAALGAAAFAGQILLLEGSSRRRPLRVLIFVEVLTTVGLTGLACWLSDAPLPPLSLHLGMVALYLGVVATAFCLTLQGIGQAATSASRAAFIYALEPVFAAALAWAWRGDRLTGLEVLGGGCIVLAALVAERPWPWPGRRPAPRQAL